MKKYFLLMAGFILLAFMACQSDEFTNGGSGGETTASFSIELPNDDSSVTTRTAGDGAQVNRCIMEVYQGGELYLRKAVAITKTVANFDVRLITSQTYDFVFWADHVASTEGDAINTDLHYTTNTVDGLQAISLKGNYEGSSKDDTRDAFFAKESSVTVTGAFSKAVRLYRPFGQLNIKTTDINDIKSADLKPVTASLAFTKVYTNFNALTGEAVGELTAVSYNKAAEVVDTDGNLTVDYLFAPVAKQTLADIVLAVYDQNGKEITNRNLTNIPIQRNYKTNVSGNLMTAAGTFTVSVIPDFTTPDIDETLTEVSSMSEAVEALNSGKTNIKIAEAPTEATTLTLPKYENKEDVAVAITLPATTAKVTIEVNNASGATGNPPAELHITTPSAGEIEINAPETTVTLNGETYTTVNASTAPNTLIVESGVSIGTLNLKKGNVKLYGKVTTVSKATDCPAGEGIITRCLDNQKSFDNLMSDNTSGYTSVLIERDATFDAAKAVSASVAFDKPLKITANAVISNLKMNVTADLKSSSPIEILDGAADVTFDNLTLSSTGMNSLLKVHGDSKKVTIRNSSIQLTPKSNGQSGINVKNAGSNSTLSVVLENTYIGFGATKLNQDKNQDYVYTEEKKTNFTGAPYSRAITLGYDLDSLSTYDGTSTTNLTVNDCVFEGVYYVVNTLHNVSLNVNVNNSILDGRAAFNVWSNAERGSTFAIKNSKLIGRNCFAGPTEEFATIVLNGENDQDKAAVKIVRNNVFTLDNCDVVSDNNPQTETNYQFGFSLRSPYYNKIVLKNNTKFREVNSPRLPHAVDIDADAWRNEVSTDGTVNLEGCAAGATLLPSNQWNGSKYIDYVSVADDGKIYVGDPCMLAMMVKSGFDGKGKEVVLVRDLDMGSHSLSVSESFNSIRNCILNGNNHIIANYTISNAKYAGLLPNAISVTIKNLTLRNANVEAVNDGSNNAYAGGFIGCAYGTNVVENCILENSTVQGINKVGGIAGFQAENGISIRNCTVKGSTIKVDTNNQEYGQCGGIIGYIGAVAGDNEVSGNFIINSKVEAPANTNVGEEHRKSSICVGVLHGVAGQSLTINMPAHCIEGSTFNGKTMDTTDYQGLLGGVRNLQNKPVITINGMKY